MWLLIQIFVVSFCGSGKWFLDHDVQCFPGPLDMVSEFSSITEMWAIYIGLDRWMIKATPSVGRVTTSAIFLIKGGDA